MKGFSSPGASEAMVSKVPATVIRSPTYASTGVFAASLSASGVVIGALPMKPWTLIDVHVRSDSLVTVPVIMMGPLSGT